MPYAPLAFSETCQKRQTCYPNTDQTKVIFTLVVILNIEFLYCFHCYAPKLWGLKTTQKHDWDTN